MLRPFLAAVVVTLGLLAPAAGASAAQIPAPASRPLTISAPGASVATAAIAAKKKDACASRSKRVTTLKRRYRTARSTKGRARTLRLLNAARRSLKRCRAQKPAPESAAPAPGPAPAPAPGPAPVPGPVPAPTPEPPATPGPAPAELRLTVNDGSGGTFSPTTPLTVAVTGLDAPADGWTYGLSVRVPEDFTRPPIGCSRSFDSPRFTETGSAATFTPPLRWCEGTGSVFVWTAPAGTPWDKTIKKVAFLGISVPAS